MHVTNITDDYNIISSIIYTNMSNDYDNITSTNMTLSNCTYNEDNFDIIIPTLLLTIPCGLSFIMSNEFDGVNNN